VPARSICLARSAAWDIAGASPVRGDQPQIAVQPFPVFLDLCRLYSTLDDVEARTQLNQVALATKTHGFTLRAT